MSNAPQYCWLCTVIFTNLVVFSNVLATIIHRIVKNLYKKKSLTKSKNVSGHSPLPPWKTAPEQFSAMKLPQINYPPNFCPQITSTELPLNKFLWTTVPPDN